MTRYICLDFESINNDYEYYKIGENYYFWIDDNPMSEKVKLKKIDYIPENFIELSENDTLPSSYFYDS